MMDNPFALKGKRYLVTGAASGIGRSSAEILSALGAELILADRNEDGLVKTLGRCPSAVKMLPIDLMEVHSISSVVETAVKEFGKLHGVVHAAGVPYISPLKAVDMDKLHRVFAVNTYAAAEIAKAFSSRKVYAGESGSVVFISSVYASVGCPCNAGYAMSKAAIEGLTRALAMEFAGRKIRVNCIAPGFIKTPMDKAVSGYFDNEHEDVITGLHPLGLGQPSDVAYAIAYLLSEASRWVTGTIMHVDGGFTAQ
ncbi:MAG: SDR family oxidoreductase [Cloacibacillus sp.]